MTFCSWCLPALALLCQDPAPQPTAAASAPHFTIDSIGPAGWRQQFGPTNLGAMLESARGQALWRDPAQALLGHWELPGVGADATAAARERLLGYGGRVRLGMWLLPEVHRLEPHHGALALLGDGRTDLAAFAIDLEQALYRDLPGAWTEHDLAGRKLRVREIPAGLVTAPILDQGRLLLVFGSSDELAAALADAEAMAADFAKSSPGRTAPAFDLRLDLARLAATLGADRRLEQVLGLASLRELGLRIGTAGPHVQIETSIDFTDAPRGLFGVLFPDRQGLPAMLRSADRESGAWKAGRLDLQALFQVVRDAASFARSSPDEEPSPAAAEAELQQELGIHLHRDLLAHTGDEYLLLLPPLRGDDDLERTTWGFALRLRDTAAFTRGFDAMMKQLKPYLSRADDERHGDIRLRRYGNMFGYPLWMAIGNDLFTIAGGGDAEAMLRKLLDGGRELPASGSVPESFAALERHLPPGCNGLGHLAVASVLALPDWLWFDLLLPALPWPRPGSADGEPEAVEREAARALLQEHQLDTLRSATGYHQRIWRYRLYW